MEPVSITAGRLHLRPWDAGDVEVVLRAGTDPLVQRWTQVPVPYTRADAEDFAGRYVPQSWAEDGELVWAVCDSTSGAPLASVGLHAPGRNGVREVGFWCLPEARGGGVVAEAVHAVARWAFAVLDLPRLEWATEVGNAPSLRVAVKAGFAFEGRRRSSLRSRDGGVVDGWWAARLPADGPEGVAPALPDPGVLDVPAGERPLRLRRWRAEDAAPLAAAIGDEPNTLPPSGHTTAGGRAHWWVTEGDPERWVTGDGLGLAVVDAGTGEVVGSVQMMLRGRRPGVAEVGVWIARPARGRGVATTALEAMLGWAVPALGLARLEWHADPANAASLALGARLGFHREGVLRAAHPAEPGGRRGDDVLLARLVGRTTYDVR